MSDFEPNPFPELATSNPLINRAYRVAMGDLLGNVRMFRDGLLEQPQPVILAGLDYDTPWTRDAAINTWNGLGLIWPATARNTLLAVLEKSGQKHFIGGQYWDAIIWTLGAWAYFLSTGEREFLKLAHEAVTNSLARFEVQEFDNSFGLFRGPAVYGDGVAAYPDRYSPGGTSSILDWVASNPRDKAPAGYGIPMMTLSTNCVYAQAYRIADQMAAELGLPPNPAHAARAQDLLNNIQKHLWNPRKASFNYLIDRQGSCDYQEGLGHAFALLFDLASADQARAVLDNQHITAGGIPCVWPTFPRYAALGGVGRHSGTVWPVISGFWGEAALKHRRPDLFETEFNTLTKHINRDNQCAEIYHPESGEIYGGLQEAGRGPDGMQWDSCARQSWSASAYLRLILTGLCGLRFSPRGILFEPYLPAGTDKISFGSLPYQSGSIQLELQGHGGRIIEFKLNGMTSQPFLPAGLTGKQHIQITLGSEDALSEGPRG